MRNRAGANVGLGTRGADRSAARVQPHPEGTELGFTTFIQLFMLDACLFKAEGNNATSLSLTGVEIVQPPAPIPHLR
jgi:hypothetical protein